MNFYNFNNLVCVCYYNGCIMNEWCYFFIVYNEIVGRNVGFYMNIFFIWFFKSLWVFYVGKKIIFLNIWIKFSRIVGCVFY